MLDKEQRRLQRKLSDAARHKRKMIDKHGADWVVGAKGNTRNDPKPIQKIVKQRGVTIHRLIG